MASEAEQVPPASPSWIVGRVESVGNGVLGFFRDLGGILAMAVSMARWMARPPLRLQNIFAQFDFLGVGSIVIVAMTGLFTGMVFATQSWSAFERFGAEGLVAPTVGLAISRELAPVFSTLMVTMRAGSAICTELGTMRVTEQVDALETMAVNPIQYLLVPRVLSGLLMVPLLTMLFDSSGFFGTFLIAVGVKGLSLGTFLLRSKSLLVPMDVGEGLIKGAVFGYAVILIACYRGYHASGGAKGVGRATTSAMVNSAVAIFVLDFLLGLLFH